MAFHNVPPNGFPDLPDVEELAAVEKDVKALKTATSEQGAAITALGTAKAAKADIAPTFSAESNYAVGDLVYYEGALYECTTAHEAAAWDAEDFTAATIDGELSSLKSGLTNVKGITDYFIDLAVGESVIIGGNHLGFVAWLGWNGLQARGEVALDPRVLIRPSNTYSFTFDDDVNIVLPTTGASVNASSLVSSVTVGNSGEVGIDFTSNPFGTANNVIVLIKTKIKMTRTA